MSASPRDWAESLLYTYTAIADRKDVDSVVALLEHAAVEFPHAKAANVAELRELFGRLWNGPHAHRHVVTNVLVDDGEAGRHVASALYSRYSLEPAPILTTLGSYRLEFSVESGKATIRRLVVSRAWQLEH